MKNWKLKFSLFLNFLVLAILLNSVGAVALQVQRTYGIPASAAGMLAAFKGLGIVTASFLAVSHLARIGYRKTMLWSLGMLTLVCLLLPSVPGFAMIQLLFVIVGAGFALIKVAVYATIGLFATDRQSHASFMNFLESFFAAGIVGGYFLFGAFADDAHPQSTAWLNVFYVIAALSLAALLLLLSVKLDESAVRVAVVPSWREHFAAVARLTFTRTVGLFGLCIFFYVMVDQGVMNWLPTFNHQVLHLSARLSIQLASLLTVAVACGRFLAGVALRRIPWFPVLVACLLATAGLMLAALSFVGGAGGTVVMGWTDVPATALILPLTGFFLGPVYPILNSIILNTLPAREHGPMSGLSVIFSAFGSSIGTVALGYLFQAHGGSFAYYFSLFPLGALLVCLFFFRRQVS